MTIVPGKDIYPAFVVFFGGTVFLLVFYIVCGFSLLGLGIFVVLNICILPWYIASGRKFVFDSDGVTVQFLWIKKQYRWDELQLKQYVTYGGIKAYASVIPKVKAVEFYTKKVTIPKMDAHSYSMLFHPFAFIFVYFPPFKTWRQDTSWNERGRTRIIYEADEEEFLAKLNEWGVELETVFRGNKV